MTPRADSCTISIRVTPRSSKNRIEPGPEGVFKVYVTVPPEDGRANDAACETLAKALGIGKSNVSIAAGHTSRNKKVHVSSLNEAEVLARLGG